MARIARMLIAGELLREILHLPVATEIIGSGAYHGGTVEVFVSHPDLRDIPFQEGVCPPLIRPTFMRQEPVIFEDWGQG